MGYEIVVFSFYPPFPFNPYLPTKIDPTWICIRKK